VVEETDPHEQKENRHPDDKTVNHDPHVVIALPDKKERVTTNEMVNVLLVEKELPVKRETNGLRAKKEKGVLLDVPINLVKREKVVLLVKKETNLVKTTVKKIGLDNIVKEENMTPTVPLENMIPIVHLENMPLGMLTKKLVKDGTTTKTVPHVDVEEEVAVVVETMVTDLLLKTLMISPKVPLLNSKPNSVITNMYVKTN